MTDLHHIGIAGAGTMGSGIAQVFAQAGFRVTIYDVQAEALDYARQKITQSLKSLVDKNKITHEQYTDIIARIQFAASLHHLQCDMLVEAVAENPEVKHQLFKQAEEVLSPQAIMVTNTSSLSVTELAASLKYPQRFAGLHFFNPAPVMKLVEVVRGTLTDENVITRLTELIAKTGKHPVVVNDSPGFIVNRVARPFYTEALKLLEEQVAGVAEIDRLMRATGFRMGPFELMDLIGNDVNFSVTRSVYQAFMGEPRFRPSRIQEQKVRAGHLGRKTGKGFYDYEAQ
jgi:3-hydroxybutyryl-CoA dehydrogenase